MTTGNIFILMMNDGKQDIYLNATHRLLQRIDEIYTQKIQRTLVEQQAYFAAGRGTAAEITAWRANPNEYSKQKSQAVHTSMMEISKTHTVYIGAAYKPFAAMAYSYLKINEKEGAQKFGGDVAFVVPQVGTWIHDMVLHVRLTGFQAVDARDKVKYCDFVGHRILETVRFQVNNINIADYTSEYYNKYWQFHVPPNKQRGWMRNMGQETPHRAYVTPNPGSDEYREYKLYGDGAQTYKNQQDDLDLYIPLLFWFNLDVAQAFPNAKVNKGSVKISVKFADIAKLVDYADGGGGGLYTVPQITTADLYVNHINTLPQIEKIILQDYTFNLIRVPKTYERVLSNSDDNILLKELKYAVEHMAVAFRPLENYDSAENWYRNVRLTAVQVGTAASYTTGGDAVPVVSTVPTIYYTETDVVDYVGMKINDIEIHPYDTVKKYSSFHPYAACGMNAPEDRGWLLFTNQFKNNYNPSGHLDLSRNREIYLQYQSTISSSRMVKLIVIAQCINFLTISNNSINLKFNT